MPTTSPSSVTGPSPDDASRGGGVPRSLGVPAVAGIFLGTVYAATLAPSITLWDSGEFNAAVASLGIPHPPGTPLYVLIGRVWTGAVAFLPGPLAMNLLSAAATAVACGLLAGLMARWTGSRLAGIAAGVSSGTMLAVWQNATETEVYAVSLLLAVLMIRTGEAAGRLGSARHRVLLAFLMALAVPLQISALVAAPAAIALAAGWAGGHPLATDRLVTSGGAFLVVAGAGLASPLLAAVGVAALAAAAVRWPAVRGEGAAVLAVIALGLSATLVLMVRAAHDPLVNQGNPATWGAFLDVIARRQYDVPGLWPRRAPLWAQLVNLVQYADWQVASGLDDGVAASWRRTPLSAAALVAVVAGARRLRAAAAGPYRGAALLLLSASLGVVAVLNLRAGPSISDAVLPAGATHEPRERDYFFALAFAVAGAWYGAGAATLAGRLVTPAGPRLAAGAALAAAALPMALNWRAADRSRPAIARLAPAYGEALLASAPREAVLLMAGDNDSYPVWHRQAALNERRDVVPVTVPLLGARWYRDELRRRHGLLDASLVNTWAGEDATVRGVVAAAAGQGRPVAVSLAWPASFRNRMAPDWTMRGLLLVPTPGRTGIDEEATRRIADLLVRRLPPGSADGRDPALAWVARQARCPERMSARPSAPLGAPVESLLASICNLR